MRNYFEEMNVDYDELKKYEEIETYYDEIQDYSKLIQELQGDRVEALKQIVKKNKEIARLNKIIDKIKNIVFDKNIWEDEYDGCLKITSDNMCERYYLLKELRKILKEEGKNE